MTDDNDNQQFNILFIGGSKYNISVTWKYYYFIGISHIAFVRIIIIIIIQYVFLFYFFYLFTFID